MKIVVYGVSRSGKDYLIKCILKYSRYNAYHLRGSSTLEDLSRIKFGCSFEDTDERQKTILRKEFIKLVHEKEKVYGTVFVDGHYSFCDEDRYKVVFTDEDKLTYDLFLYLDTPSKMILNYSRNSNGIKQNLTISIEDIKRWKKFEKDSLRTICEGLNKELIILDEDTSSCIEFIDEYLTPNKLVFAKSPSKIAEMYLKDIKLNKSKVLLLDCDKTISENDVTYDFCSFLDIDTSKLKSIFRNDRYTSYQFFKLNNLYKNISVERLNEGASLVVDKIIINRKINKLIKKSNDFTIIGITSGLYHIWIRKSYEEKLLDYLIGCKEYNTDPLLVTPYVKRAVARIIKEKGFEVYSIGDSVIDIPMLEEANSGFIVAHKKINNAVYQYFLMGKSNVKQFSFSDFKYPNIKNVGDIS